MAACFLKKQVDCNIGVHWHFNFWQFIHRLQCKVCGYSVLSSSNYYNNKKSALAKNQQFFANVNDDY